MSEFNVGDAVRIKGQRGRPTKWIIQYFELDKTPVEISLINYNHADQFALVLEEHIAPYKEYVKKEKSIDEQL